MSLQESDYQRLYQITKKRLNELPMQSSQFEDIRELLNKLRTEVEKFSLHNVTTRNWFERLPIHWRYVWYMAGGILIGLLLPYVW